MAAVTDEDLAFERSLQDIEINEPAIERGPNTDLRAEKCTHTLLKDIEPDTKPAADMNELLGQIFKAKELGADSVEADPKLIKAYTHKSGYPTDVGYFWFQDCKVWIPGFFDKLKHKDGETVEHRVFGASRLRVQPIMQIAEEKKETK
jgi:hypothetical protein